MVKVINSADFDQVLSSPSAVVDFSATWCGPCHMMAPVMDKLSDELAGKWTSTTSMSMRTRNSRSATASQASPCLIVFRDGKEVDRKVGFMPEPTIKPVLEKYAE
jgi:thioredoxin 1